MENEHNEEISDKTPPVEVDWENRTLCSDGNCIGVIGSDGSCKECGKPYDGPTIEGQVFDADTADEVDEEIEDEEVTADKSDWEDRQLCSDGNCIGIIGSDGRCKECGKPY
jgi:hypothetical protein